MQTRLVAQMRRRIALILSGCGVYDGTELTEVSAMMVQLSRRNAQFAMFAPNIDQAHVINHLNGEPMPESRNVLVESARIARGNIKPLSYWILKPISFFVFLSKSNALVDLEVSDFDGLLVPGGFGCAKNLSNFAFEGENMSANEDVIRILNEFKKEGKPIGLCCIAPILSAYCFDGVELTLGKKQGKQWPHASAIAAASSMGARCTEKDVDEMCVDAENRIFTTPAYMKDVDQPHLVFDGVVKLVDRVVNECGNKNF
ncbi:hypothetical protein ACOME3_005800 [Neoechinorhynchus agilis]